MSGSRQVTRADYSRVMATITEVYGFDETEWGQKTEPQQVGYVQQIPHVLKLRSRSLAVAMAEVLFPVFAAMRGQDW